MVVDDNYYLVSAAHVFDDFEEIAIPLEQENFFLILVAYPTQIILRKQETKISSILAL